jgi:RNA polymerase sigma factor (sigma-70 family)
MSPGRVFKPRNRNLTSLSLPLSVGFRFPHSPMSEPPPAEISAYLDAVFRAESGRILATLIRLLGGFDVAEDAMHDAFNAALQRWPVEGFPANPRAWLISTARFKAIDAIRRRTRFDASQDHIADALYGDTLAPGADDDELSDDRLKLIFTCCHPALAAEACAALTLREVCGLTTEEIARAFLTSAPTIAQRIVRAKAKIRDEGIPYQVPSGAELQERVSEVLAVVYLLFNEGYAASSGPSLTRADLSAEAIRLGRVLLEHTLVRQGWNEHLDLGTVPPAGSDIKGTPHVVRTLAHAVQAQAALSVSHQRERGQVESHTVVVDCQPNEGAPLPQAQRNVLGAGVLLHVPKRLLHYPVER